MVHFKKFLTKDLKVKQVAVKFVQQILIPVLYSHIHIQIYVEHNHCDDKFSKRTNTLLYKNIISHTLFLKG